MRGRTTRDWREGKRRYMILFSTGSAAMRFYDEQIEVGALIESGTYEVWCVERSPGRFATGFGTTGKRHPTPATDTQS